MKIKISIGLTTSITILMIIVFCSIFSTNTFNAFAQTEVISINETKTVVLATNEIKPYYFTPDSDGFYVVETMGELDTKLKVSGILSGEIINDDFVDINSSNNRNARIWFKAEKDKQIKIEVKPFNIEPGTTALQVRKQRFSMFSYIDEDGNDMIQDFNIPYDLFCNLYETVKYEDKTAFFARSDDERGLSRLNSEIVFFSGHGYKDNETQKGHGIDFYSNGAHSGLYNTTPLNMDKVKVAMWAACFSANSTNSRNLSFAEHIKNCGAAASVGFEDEVTFAVSRLFTNGFFYALSNGDTVNDAAYWTVKNFNWITMGNAHKYKVFVDGNIKVTSETSSLKVFL